MIHTSSKSSKNKMSMHPTVSFYIESPFLLTVPSNNLSNTEKSFQSTGYVWSFNFSAKYYGFFRHKA